ncbi:hypothetical protein ACVIVD_003181 [Bradyrhizobium liaoningense]
MADGGQHSSSIVHQCGNAFAHPVERSRRGSDFLRAIFRQRLGRAIQAEVLRRAREGRKGRAERAAGPDAEQRHACHQEQERARPGAAHEGRHLECPDRRLEHVAICQIEPEAIVFRCGTTNEIDRAFDSGGGQARPLRQWSRGGGNILFQLQLQRRKGSADVFKNEIPLSLRRAGDDPRNQLELLHGAVHQNARPVEQKIPGNQHMDQDQ